MDNDLSSMQIGVTGAAGFIGSRLVRALLAQGARVRTLVHKTPLDLPADSVKGDICHQPTLDHFLDGMDMVFHLATALGNRRIPEAEFFRINSTGVTSLLEAAQRAGVARVIHFSSAGVFGLTSGMKLLQEEDSGHPVDPYEKSKLAGEKNALEWTGAPSVSVIRPGWVYGEGDRRTFKLIRKIHKGPFFIAGPGRVLQTPVYVDDLVAAAISIGRDGQSGRVYHAAGPPVSVNELVAAIARAVGRSPDFLHIPTALLLPPARILEILFGILDREPPLNRARLAFFRRGKPLDASRIETELGVTFPTSLEEGMRRAVRGYRDLGWLPPA